MPDLTDGLRTDEAILQMAREAADAMLSDTDDSGRVSLYEGTRWECEAFLDSYFSIQRNVVLGARSVASEDEVGMYDSQLDVLDRRAFRVTVRPIGIAKGKVVRPENEHRVMRMRTALDMYDAIARGVRESAKDEDDMSENVPE